MPRIDHPQAALTLDNLRAAVAVGQLCLALARLAGTRPVSERVRAAGCRWTCSEPFRYMIGCTDEPVVTGRATGHFGRPEQYRACLHCHALELMTRPAHCSTPEHNQFLLDLQAAAGIEDYRRWRAPREWKKARESARRRRARLASKRRAA